MNQSKLVSWVEAGCNTGSGFIISLIYWQLAVAPQLELWGHGFGSSSLITCQFTVISVIRSYIWRRLFDRFHAWVHGTVDRLLTRIKTA